MSHVHFCGGELSPSDIPPFLGGLSGYVGYEVKSECLPVPSQQDAMGFPDAFFMFFDRLICFDHHTRRIILISLSHQNEGDEMSSSAWLFAMTKEIQRLAMEPSMESETNDRQSHYNGDPLTVLQPDLNFKEYIQAIKLAQKYISSGDTYEVCMTTAFQGKYNVDCFQSSQLYKIIRKNNPAPYGAFLRLNGHQWIACSSPERFLRVERNQLISMKPIKGTSPRFKDVQQDRLSKRNLEESIKDRAENLMITDLTRNDLTKIALPGSVSVPKLMEVESYQSVHQCTYKFALKYPYCFLFETHHAF
jgi:para-aminobenzoate synthetase